MGIQYFISLSKSAPAEVAAALRLLEATALAHLEVHFRVTHNGRPVRSAPRAPQKDGRRVQALPGRLS